MTTCIDLFAGIGGNTVGAEMAQAGTRGPLGADLAALQQQLAEAVSAHRRAEEEIRAHFGTQLTEALATVAQLREALGRSAGAPSPLPSTAAQAPQCDLFGDCEQ